MIGTLSFFVISILGMSIIFISNRFYKGRIYFLEKTDAFIVKTLGKGKKILLFINKKTIGLFAHYILEELENFFIKVFRKLKNIVKK